MRNLNAALLLSNTVESVLERMFFCVPLGPSTAEAHGPAVKSRLSFQGEPSGTFEVCLSEPAARSLAADFLGEDADTLTASQPGEVVCELSNMLCGSFLSSLEKDQHFDLTSPEIVPDGPEVAGGVAITPTECQSFELENGILTVTLTVQAAL